MPHLTVLWVGVALRASCGASGGPFSWSSGVTASLYACEKGYQTMILPEEVRQAECEQPAESWMMWCGRLVLPGLVGEVRAGAVWWYA